MAASEWRRPTLHSLHHDCALSPKQTVLSQELADLLLVGLDDQETLGLLGWPAE